jgi:predicted transcriptional regulator
MPKEKNNTGAPKEHHSIKIDGKLWLELQDLADMDNRSKNNLIETVLKGYRDKQEEALMIYQAKKKKEG